MTESLRINILPLNAKSFRREDDLYFADSLFQEGQPRQSVHRITPLKVEICFSLFCVQGTVILRVDQKDYELCANDVLLAMPGSILEKVIISESDEVILLAFDRDTIPRDIRAGGMSSFLSKSFSILSSVYTLSEERMNNFKSFYVAARDMLLEEQDKAIINNVLQGFAYITLGIMDGWVHSSETLTSRDNSRAQRIVSDFMSDIRHFVAEQREVSFYAQRAALSPKCFSRLVIKQTGRRPLDHIRGYIALEAKCQLGSGRYTIKQVADNLNFSDTSSFTRFFRSETGLTPAEYSASLLV